MFEVIVQSQKELDACLEVRREVFIGEQQVPEDIEVDEYDVLGTDVIHVLVHDDEHRPVATARLKPYQEDTVKVQRVAVRRVFRGRGIGTLVMNLLERLAKEQGYRYVILDAQCHAKDFYQGLGYDTVSDTFMEAGIEHVRMKKALQ